MEIVSYILLGVLILLALIIIIIKAIKIMKLSPEEKKKVLITYLKGLVALVEREIGSGNGAKKLEEVEDNFKTKAPSTYKIILFLVGKDNLKDLVEEALKQIKEDFGE